MVPPDPGAVLEPMDIDGEPGVDPIDLLTPITPSARVGQFRHNTVSGAILAGVAIGLRDVFDPVDREEPPIILDWSGDPPAPRPIDVDLDPDDPAASSVTVRPHLFAPFPTDQDAT